MALPMARRMAVLALCVACLPLSSCGGSFSVGFDGGGVPGPAWVSIEAPTSEPAYTTADNAVTLSGSAFVSEGYYHGPPWDSGVAVSWRNDRTGESGPCNYYTVSSVFSLQTKWSVSVPLEIGANPITITAYEYLAPPSEALRATAGITVTRN